jgi:NAD(P)-dependent dehydrogenase (short-subunit alcohol dehydrogenase family)
MGSDNHDSGSVVIVPNAGTVEGYRTVRALLAAGHRVVATDRHAAALVRLLHERDADRLLLLAADTTDAGQWRSVLDRATTRFGHSA